MPGLRRSLSLLVPLAALALIALSCGEETTGIDLDRAPPSPRGFQVTNGDSSVTLRWDFLEEVTPTVSFSGYKVFFRAADDDSNSFFPALALDYKPHDNTRLPLIKRRNSLADDHMEVRVLNLKPGVPYEFYVVGLQNGLTGPRSSVRAETPFRLVERVSIRDEAEIRSWFYMHELFTRYSVIDDKLVGYDFDPNELSHHLLWMPTAEGGHLRIQRGGARILGQKAPTEGYIEDPEQGKIELAAGDGFWVWDTNGTPTIANDDHYGRIDVTRIVVNSSARRIEIDCAYQVRPNTRNF